MHIPVEVLTFDNTKKLEGTMEILEGEKLIIRTKPDGSAELLIVTKDNR